MFNITQLRLFRNTHLAPDFKLDRPDLPAYEATNPEQSEPAWIFHLLDHKEGSTYYELLADAREYLGQHENRGISNEELWLEIKAALKVTLIRVEF